MNVNECVGCGVTLTLPTNHTFVPHGTKLAALKNYLAIVIHLSSLLFLPTVTGFAEMMAKWISTHLNVSVTGLFE